MQEQKLQQVKSLIDASDRLRCEIAALDEQLVMIDADQSRIKEKPQDHMDLRFHLCQRYYYVVSREREELIVELEILVVCIDDAFCETRAMSSSAPS